MARRKETSRNVKSEVHEDLDDEGEEEVVDEEVVDEEVVDEEDAEEEDEEEVVDGEADEEDDVYKPDEDEEEADEETPVAKTAPAKRTPAKSAPRKTPATKRTPRKTPAAKSGSDDDNQEPGKRYFKILVSSIIPENKSPNVQDDDISSGGGRYTGKNPMQAAKKAFTRICRVATAGGECTYIFSIQETTQTSSKKSFTYRGVRTELEKPQEVKKGDTTYLIRFNSEVRSHKPDGVKKTPATKKTPAKASAPSSAKKTPAKAPAKSSTPSVRGRPRAGRGRGKKM